MFRRLESDSNKDFRTDIPEYPDDKIIEILKLRDYYQPEAAKLAITEAIKRGIIYSEQDLFSEQYKVEKLKYTLIPNIVKPENKESIRRSIARSLVICGVIPLVFGLLEINAHQSFEGFLVLSVGLLWMFCSSQLIKTYRKICVFTLLLAALIGIIYALHNVVETKSFVFMDFFIPLSLFLLVVYGLFFLKKCSES